MGTRGVGLYLWSAHLGHTLLRGVHINRTAGLAQIRALGVSGESLVRPMVGDSLVWLFSRSSITSLSSPRCVLGTVSGSGDEKK